MYQLNYRSTSKNDLKPQDLENILERANTVNTSRNISGCLIYYNNSFVQILEGDKKDVLDIYHKIKMDKRHDEVTLLWENQVENRFFEEWNMAYYRPEDKDVKQFVNNLLLLSDLSERSSSSLLSFWATVRKILRAEPMKA